MNKQIVVYSWKGILLCKNISTLLIHTVTLVTLKKHYTELKKPDRWVFDHNHIHHLKILFINEKFLKLTQ